MGKILIPEVVGTATVSGRHAEIRFLHDGPNGKVARAILQVDDDIMHYIETAAAGVEDFRFSDGFRYLNENPAAAVNNALLESVGYNMRMTGPEFAVGYHVVEAIREFGGAGLYPKAEGVGTEPVYVSPAPVADLAGLAIQQYEGPYAGHFVI